MLVAALVPMPPRGLWRVKAGARNSPLTEWLGRETQAPAPQGTDPVGEALVCRYLAAYGPAASAGLRAWCGLPAAVAAVRGELTAFHDERGRELLDPPGVPRPDARTPAPVRFLPAFDNGDPRLSRSQPGHRRRLPRPLGRGGAVVLVGGRVSAASTVDAGAVTVGPLRGFTRDERGAVAEEGSRLALFLFGGGSDGVRITEG